MNDKVEGHNSEGRVDFSPLEVMFSSYLNRGRESEGKGNERTIEGVMAQLSFSPIGLKGSKLSIGPPCQG